jgi:N utilization substance protein B
MSARSKARKRALDILFEADQRRVPIGDVLANRRTTSDPRGPLPEHTVACVEGVAANLGRIDELISTYSVGWTLDRMPAVDRTILRIAVFELLWLDDVPDGVVLSEAVSLARELSTDDSPGFVNGLLAAILDVKPALTP